GGHLQRHDERHELAGRQLRQLGHLARAGLPVDAGGLGHGGDPDVRRRHELRHGPLCPQPVLYRVGDHERLQRRRLREQHGPLPRLEAHPQRHGRTTYFIVVDGYGGAAGSFALQVTPPGAATTTTTTGASTTSTRTTTTTTGAS